MAADVDDDLGFDTVFENVGLAANPIDANKSSCVGFGLGLGFVAALDFVPRLVIFIVGEEDVGVVAVAILEGFEAGGVLAPNPLVIGARPVFIGVLVRDDDDDDCVDVMGDEDFPLNPLPPLLLIVAIRGTVARTDLGGTTGAFLETGALVNANAICKSLSFSAPVFGISTSPSMEESSHPHSSSSTVPCLAPDEVKGMVSELW
mmetsp:Transcript_698/g.965  ORF Transcript_698/g.965 Transcript_698/m.965 type:complete len:204 (+) Transcript_698:164-775(+)